MSRDKFQRLANYDRWANSRLYAAALDLSDQAYRLHIGVFFGSLHGTLNLCEPAWRSLERRRRRAGARAVGEISGMVPADRL